jgi:hypothetical protein
MMKTVRAVNLRDFSIGLVLALAEKGILVIDKPGIVLSAAIESAYEAIRIDVERDQKSKLHASLYETIGESFDPVEIIDYALGARLLTRKPPGQLLEVMQNESFTRAYFELRPARGNLYRKAAQAFLDYAG